MSIFNNKVAIITGAGSGIGKSISEQLAKHGAHVVISDINEDRINQVAEEIKASGGNATAHKLDVTDHAAVTKIVNDTVKERGRIDYIFNNAGIAVAGEACDFTIDDWRSVLEVNLFGVINGVDAAYPIMVKQGSGHIVNTASIEGLCPFPNTVSYVASKYGVVGLSNSLRIEGKEYGVNVSVVCPGYIKTEIYHDSKFINYDRDKTLDIVDMLKGIGPEECAADILRGVEKNKAVIMVEKTAKILRFIARLHPALIFFTMGIANKILSKAKQEESP
jgi:NAD(P)-dependent dehydrogenase (short-subunit alcohol dehydrogenase family)